MKKTGERFLPIGTVVMLKGGEKRLMITSFCVITDTEPERMWDYGGCLYPEGFLSSDETALFDHEQIEEIYHMGLEEDDEEKEFKENLNQAMEEVEAQKESKETPKKKTTAKKPTTKTTGTKKK